MPLSQTPPMAARAGSRLTQDRIFRARFLPRGRTRRKPRTSALESPPENAEKKLKGSWAHPAVSGWNLALANHLQTLGFHLEGMRGLHPLTPTCGCVALRCSLFYPSKNSSYFSIISDAQKSSQHSKKISHITVTQIPQMIPRLWLPRLQAPVTSWQAVFCRLHSCLRSISKGKEGCSEKLQRDKLRPSGLPASSFLEWHWRRKWRQYEKLS